MLCLELIINWNQIDENSQNPRKIKNSELKVKNVWKTKDKLIYPLTLINCKKEINKKMFHCG